MVRGPVALDVPFFLNMVRKGSTRGKRAQKAKLPPAKKKKGLLQTREEGAEFLLLLPLSFPYSLLVPPPLLGDPPATPRRPDKFLPLTASCSIASSFIHTSYAWLICHQHAPPRRTHGPFGAGGLVTVCANQRDWQNEACLACSFVPCGKSHLCEGPQEAACGSARGYRVRRAKSKKKEGNSLSIQR